jgi:hypothetical protein
LTNRTFLAVVCGALLAGPAAAQNQPAPKAALTDAEKLEKAAESLERMKGSLKQILGKVEEARNEKDVVKLNCVNEKLTQVKGLIKVAEQSDIALHEALANKDPSAESEFAKIGIARSKVEGLRGDTEQCIGQLAYIVDEKTTVEVQKPAEDDRFESERNKRNRNLVNYNYKPPVHKPRPASEWQPVP